VPTVVIVDDNPAFRKAAERLLSARGLDVVAGVGSCAAGRDAVAELKPDGVLLDIELPDGTGYEVAREWNSGSVAPLVVLTSTDECQLERASLASIGVRAFIRKEDLAGADLAALFGR